MNYQRIGNGNAMGFQHNIASMIVERGANYVLAVKDFGNNVIRKIIPQ